MQREIRFGIIGAGNIARSFAKGIVQAKGVSLYAVAARSKESAEAFAKEFDAKVSYGSYEELVQDELVDVIYISTPNALHKDHALLCIRHHKAVICEKPLASNAKEVAEMIEEAEKHNVFLMEAMWTRYFPLIQQIKKCLEEGEIGQLQMLQGDFGFSGKSKDNIRYNLELAGGALMDVGIYPVSFASFVFGKQPQKVKALGLIGDTGVDERTSIIFEYDKGEMALMSSSLITQTPREMMLIGEKGYIRIPNVWQARECFIHIKGEEVRHYALDFEGNGYNYEIEEVVRCLCAGEKESSKMPHKESLAIMETMDKIRKEIGLKFEADK